MLISFQRSILSLFFKALLVISDLKLPVQMQWNTRIHYHFVIEYIYTEHLIYRNYIRERYEEKKNERMQNIC